MARWHHQSPSEGNFSDSGACGRLFGSHISTRFLNSPFGLLFFLEYSPQIYFRKMPAVLSKNQNSIKCAGEKVWTEFSSNIFPEVLKDRPIFLQSKSEPRKNFRKMYSALHAEDAFPDLFLIPKPVSQLVLHSLSYFPSVEFCTDFLLV